MANRVLFLPGISYLIRAVLLQHKPVVNMSKAVFPPNFIWGFATARYASEPLVEFLAV